MITRSPVELTAPIDLTVAARLLAEWGFLAHPDLPNQSGDAYLLVALRDRPTLHHFDPERVDLWANCGSRGTRLEITRATHRRETEFSWGPITITDRLGVSNEYVSLGGRLTVDAVDGMTIAALSSPAPILRRGGHSQGWDDAAVDLAAFFGRVLLAVDYVPDFERRMAEATPLARYGSFLIDSLRRYRRCEALRAAHPDLWTLLSAELERLQRDHPEDRAAGAELAESGGFASDA
jgi:hypothetical protein